MQDLILRQNPVSIKKNLSSGDSLLPVLAENEKLLTSILFWCGLSFLNVGCKLWAQHLDICTFLSWNINLCMFKMYAVTIYTVFSLPTYNRSGHFTGYKKPALELSLCRHLFAVNTILLRVFHSGHNSERDINKNKSKAGCHRIRYSLLSTGRSESLCQSLSL